MCRFRWNDTIQATTAESQTVITIEQDLIHVSHALQSGVQLGAKSGLKHASSRAATQLLPVLRSESMQNLVTLGCTVLSTCRVSPDSACAQRERS